MNPCEPNPCQNGGVCIRNSKIEFICKCKHGYHGDLCDVNSVPTLKPNSSNERNVTVKEDPTNTESKNEYCYIEHTGLVPCCFVKYILSGSSNSSSNVLDWMFWNIYHTCISHYHYHSSCFICVFDKEEIPDQKTKIGRAISLDLDKQPLLDQN